MIGSFPAGSTLTGWFDSATGARGAPGASSLPATHPSSTAIGGGAQGSADAKAGASLGGSGTGVGASIDAHAGVQHLTSGPQKGDNQLVLGLDGKADANLTNGLLGGGQADAAGNVNGELAVTYSPSGKPLTLEVVASGDGVWGVSPPSNASGVIPGKQGQEPVLKLEGGSSDGSGQGSSFTGTLDLANDPQAQQDLRSTLQGHPAGIPALIADMNSRGTESVQTYRIKRSSTTYSLSASLGVGGGAGLSDGSSTATYNPPETREGGGKWQNG